MKCMVCGHPHAVKNFDKQTLDCPACKASVTVAEEQANEVYIRRVLRREPIRFPALEDVVTGDDDPTPPDDSTGDDSPVDAEWLATLQGTKVDDLQRIAAFHGVDLSGASRKDDIIAAIVEAYPGAPDSDEETAVPTDADDKGEA